jgi:hypothetical protein
MLATAPTSRPFSALSRPFLGTVFKCARSSVHVADAVSCTRARQWLGRHVVVSLELYDASPRHATFSVLDHLFNPNATPPVSSYSPEPLEVWCAAVVDSGLCQC